MRPDHRPDLTHMQIRQPRHPRPQPVRECRRPFGRGEVMDRDVDLRAARPVRREFLKAGDRLRRRPYLLQEFDAAALQLEQRLHGER